MLTDMIPEMACEVLPREIQRDLLAEEWKEITAQPLVDNETMAAREQADSPNEPD